MKISIRISVFIAVSFLGLLARAQTAPAGREENLELQIVTDKLEYDPGSRVVVKSILTNRSEASVYVVRNLSSCLRWEGYVDLQILDKQGQGVKKTGCITDRSPIKGFDILKELNDSNLWILLGPLEVYGTLEDFELPRKKGTYRIMAELVPPQFDANQKGTLSQHKMSFLQNRLSAPVVTITVK